VTDIFEYLAARPYPGRGILLGYAPDGSAVCAYFIMGRSENSRNRVFEATRDGIRTRAFDEAKLRDPSLIIYHPVRHFGDTLIVTNGDQTDTIREFLSRRKSVYDALATRAFEPDTPNFTPRVSGVARPDGYMLSILKSDGGERCERFYYNYKPAAGEGHFISTYEGFGAPLPSFSIEPVHVSIPALAASDLAAALWNCLDEANRVSLYVEAGGEKTILNKNVQEKSL